MRGYKLIALIISGICVVLFLIIGMNVFGLNNKHNGYDVDSNYVSINEKEQEPPTVDEVKEKIKIEIKEEIKPEIEEQSVNNETEVKEIKEVKEDMIEVEKQTNSNKVNNQEIIETNKDNDNNQGNGTNKEIDIEEQLDLVEREAPIEYTGNKWVDDKIVENKDQISDTDLQSGLAIGDKIDTDLIMAYLEDGLTDDEKESLKKYLKSVLSDSEYETVKVLIGRYSSMVD